MFFEYRAAMAWSPERYVSERSRGILPVGEAWGKVPVFLFAFAKKVCSSKSKWQLIELSTIVRRCIALSAGTLAD